MDPKAQSSAANSNNAVYEDIEPFFEWHRDEGYDILVVMLPGFRRDELKVQVTSAPILKVSAQRQISENKWRRVYKEFPVPSDCDTNDLTAKFEAGTLKIKFPKLITPTAMPQVTPTQQRDEANDHKDAAREEQDQAKANKTTDEAVSENTQKEKEPSRDDDSTKKKPVQEDQEKGKTRDDQVSEKTPPSAQKEKEPTAAKAAVEEASASFKAHDGRQRANNIVKRSKTRVLDFTLSLRPTADDQNFKEAVAGLVTGLKKMKKLMNLTLVALLVIVLVLYVKNAFRSSLEGSQVQEL